MSTTMKARIILEIKDCGVARVSGLPDGYCLVVRNYLEEVIYPEDSLLQDLPDNVHRNDNGELYHEVVLT